MNFRTNQKYVWNTCKVLNNSWVKIKNNTISDNESYKDKCSQCLNKLSPPWVPTNPGNIPACEENEFFDTPFTFLEFNTFLNSRKKDSAPGLDGIDYEILQQMPIKFKLLLLDIYNEMYQASEYPESWLDTFVQLISKADGKSVRPISLTQCLCRVFEGMLKNRLEWWIEKNKFIPKNQSGFRKGRSCIDNLANLTFQVDEAFKNKNEVLAVFLDVSAAFPNVISDILLEKLANIKCSERFVKFAKFLTYERWIHTNIEGYKLIRLNKGVPQGGILSPLFYLIYVAQIGQGIPCLLSLSHSLQMIRRYSRKLHRLRNAKK